MSGFIKIHRALLDWEWYHDDRCVRLLLHLILKANYTHRRWKGQELQPGQLITSTVSLAEQLGWSRSTLNRTMDKLRGGQEIETKADSKWTLVTLRKWDQFQIDGEDVDSKRTPNRTASGHQTIQQVIQQADTDKEGKKERRGRMEEGKKEESSLPTVEKKAKGPDERITRLVEYIQSVNGGVMDGSVSDNRRACHTLLQRFGKEFPNRDAEDVVRHLVDYGKKDAFHGSNVTSFRYLVSHGQKIINNVKAGKSNGTQQQSTDDKREAGRMALAALQAERARNGA